MSTVTQIADRDERPAYVRFETRPIEDKKASLVAGHAVFVDVDFALVTPPYSKDCVEYKVDTWLKNVEMNVRNGRVSEDFARLWKRQYQAFKEGKEAPLAGTDIRNWSAITPAQIKNCISAGCRTIEDLASANDEACRRIGMGAMELRNKARAYLQATKDHGPLVMENAALKTKVAQLEGAVESLKNQVEALLSEKKQASDIRFEYQDSASDISVNEISMNDLIDEPSLADQYKAKFGKPPHHRMKEESILKALE